MIKDNHILVLGRSLSHRESHAHLQCRYVKHCLATERRMLKKVKRTYGYKHSL